MTTFDPETFETKYHISDAATDLYIEGDGKFTIKEVAKKLEMDPADIFNYFPNKKAILEFYYASLVIRYELMTDEIEEFTSYTISEKLSNFIYTSFDMLQEKEAFVDATFKSMILCNFAKTDFEKEVERLTEKFLREDENLAVSTTMFLNQYLYSFLRRQYLELVRFWLNDNSEDHELTMELTDKLTSFIEELLYNTVFDKGFELAKFIYSNRKVCLQNIPIIKQVLSKVEIR
ncbi:MAG TPA: hypothetical protein VJ964_09505 [Balneolaceae bacterium]|nr:hypothetical protein [Balneolaceae bacterium]